MNQGFIGLMGWTTFGFISGATHLIPDAANVALVIVAVAGCGWSVWRASRMELIVDESRIVIRNFVRDYELNWRDVQRIGIAYTSMGIVPLQPAIGFYLRTGGYRAAQATPRHEGDHLDLLAQVAEYAPADVEVVN